MISPKTIGILVAVLVGIGLLQYTTSKQRYGTTSGGGFEQILGDATDPGETHTIEAWLGSSPESTVVLQREGDGWTVASRFGWQAKADMVQRLLDDLDNLRGEIRSKDASLLADFELDEEDGLHVVGKASGGTELFHLVVGKSASRGGSFVRRNGGNDVFLTPVALGSSFGLWGEERKAPDTKRWIDLRIHKAEKNDVNRFVVHRSATMTDLVKEFELVEPDSAATDSTEAVAAEPTVDRTQWTWKPDGEGEFDKSTIDGLLATLCSLYASEVADPDSLEAYGLDDANRRIELHFEDGSVTPIYFGEESPEQADRVYVRVGDDGLPAMIYKSTVDRLFTERNEWKPKDG